MGYCGHEYNSEFGLVPGSNDDDNDKSLTAHINSKNLLYVILCLYIQTKQMGTKS